MDQEAASSTSISNVDSKKCVWQKLNGDFGAREVVSRADMAVLGIEDSWTDVST